MSIAAKNIKFSDMGFFDEFDNKRSLEVYSLGIPVFKADFDNFVCVDSKCMDKAEFVEKYISDALYSDIMNDILSQKQLKIESKITKTETGFIQEALTQDYEILYRVDGKELFFVERKSGFKFVMRFVD